MNRALFVQGGWDGHTPRESAELFAGLLAGEDYEVEASDTLEVFGDATKLATGSGSRDGVSVLNCRSIRGGGRKLRF